MSTQQTAKTQYVDVDGVQVAYRLFGSSTGVPLLFNQHFRGTMDHWDPLLINNLAKTRPILLFDSYGVGKSSRNVPDTFAGWATVAVNLVKALGIKEINVFGFSMGGMVAQMIALNAPEVVRRLIIGGSSPSYGEGIVSGPDWPFPKLMKASTPEESEDAFLSTFYSHTEEKQRLGREWWARMNERTEDRSPYVSPEQTARQAGAAAKWFSPGNEESGSYHRLHELKMPIFIVNGDDDIIVTTENSIVMHKQILKGNKNAHLHLYPDTGHGFLNEYSEMFAAHVTLFLDMQRVV
ncbi:alpha/beta-hydrolase [Mollisia scopiformis]|uniref:Alpha/beta-hydrolase n=1 Tax=Mollisia scopiformis TaxID=149040 RepID=A0A194X198_MOLSC|nr:alpha/beta-hydrolase [Mollisia scopiformis]KUJ13963.1 alpha/beta-hydrolase [Mollisia scopiformis]